MTKSEFIKKAIEKYGCDKYDYSCVDYFGDDVEVEVVCHKHGTFWVTPADHLNGVGCPDCKYEETDDPTVREMTIKESCDWLYNNRFLLVKLIDADPALIRDRYRKYMESNKLFKD